MEEEGQSCADGAMGVKYLSPRSLSNHRNLYRSLHSQSAHCYREIAPREELNRSTTRPVLTAFLYRFFEQKVILISRYICAGSGEDITPSSKMSKLGLPPSK